MDRMGWLLPLSVPNGAIGFGRLSGRCADLSCIGRHGSFGELGRVDRR